MDWASLVRSRGSRRWRCWDVPTLSLAAHVSCARPGGGLSFCRKGRFGSVMQEGEVFFGSGMQDCRRMIDGLRRCAFGGVFLGGGL